MRSGATNASPTRIVEHSSAIFFQTETRSAWSPRDAVRYEENSECEDFLPRRHCDVFGEEASSEEGPKKAKDRKKKGKNLEGGVLHAFLFFSELFLFSPLFVFLRGSESTRGGCWKPKEDRETRASPWSL